MDDNVNRTVKDGANGAKKHPDPPIITKAYPRAVGDSITGARHKVHTVQAKIKSVYKTIKRNKRMRRQKNQCGPTISKVSTNQASPIPNEQAFQSTSSS